MTKQRPFPWPTLLLKILPFKDERIRLQKNNPEEFYVNISPEVFSYLFGDEVSLPWFSTMLQLRGHSQLTSTFDIRRPLSFLCTLPFQRCGTIWAMTCVIEIDNHIYFWETKIYGNDRILYDNINTNQIIKVVAIRYFRCSFPYVGVLHLVIIN